MRLPIFLLRRYPRLKIKLPDFTRAHVARADVDNSVRQFQSLQKFFRNPQQLTMPMLGLGGIVLAKNILLDLEKLMNANESTRVLSARAGLAPKARRKSAVEDRQVAFFERIALVNSVHGDLRCTG